MYFNNCSPYQSSEISSSLGVSSNENQQPDNANQDNINQDNIGDEIAIFNVSGDLNHNSQIKISGNKLISSNIQPTLIYDERDNGPQLMTLNDGDVIPNNRDKYGWKPNSTQWKDALKIGFNDHPRGASSYYYHCNGQGCYLGWPKQLGGDQPPQGQNSLFVSWYFKSNVDLNEAGGSCKFIRLWDKVSGEGTRVSWTQMHMTYNPSKVSWGSYKGQTNQWNRMDLYINSKTNKIINWTNGIETHNTSDFVKDPNSTDLGLNIALLGYDVGGANFKAYGDSTFLAFREIVVHKSPARIEICSSSEFSECHNSEIQITDYVSDKEIIVTLNKGNFSELKGLYLHLINENHQSIANIQL